MTDAIQIRDLYKSGLSHFDFAPPAAGILKRVVAGDDRAEDFEEAIRSDAYLTRRVITHASEALRAGRVSTLAHAVVLLGKDNVRDFVLGQSLRRLFEANADTEVEEKLTFDNLKSRVRRAREAEALARSAGVDATGSCYAAGYLFDVFETWIEQSGELGDDERELFEAVWRHSKKTALLAWEIAHHGAFNGNLKKLSFVFGLVHDIGRLLFACALPERNRKLKESLDRVRVNSPTDDSFEAVVERNEFKIAHPEVGSLLLWRSGVLRECEALVDHHHEYAVLEGRDPQKHQAVVVLRVADRVASSLQITRAPEQSVFEEIRRDLKVPKSFSTADLSGIVASLRSHE